MSLFITVELDDADAKKFHALKAKLLKGSAKNTDGVRSVIRELYTRMDSEASESSTQESGETA
jgi:hypothetical protein